MVAKTRAPSRPRVTNAFSTSSIISTRFFCLREAPQVQLPRFSGAFLVNTGNASSLLEGFRM